MDEIERIIREHADPDDWDVLRIALEELKSSDSRERIAVIRQAIDYSQELAVALAKWVIANDDAKDVIEAAKPLLQMLHPELFKGSPSTRISSSINKFNSSEIPESTEAFYKEEFEIWINFIQDDAIDTLRCTLSNLIDQYIVRIYNGQPSDIDILMGFLKYHPDKILEGIKDKYNSTNNLFLRRALIRACRYCRTPSGRSFLKNVLLKPESEKVNLSSKKIPSHWNDDIVASKYVAEMAAIYSGDVLQKIGLRLTDIIQREFAQSNNDIIDHSIGIGCGSFGTTVRDGASLTIYCNIYCNIQ